MLFRLARGLLRECYDSVDDLGSEPGCRSEGEDAECGLVQEVFVGRARSIRIVDRAPETLTALTPRADVPTPHVRHLRQDSELRANVFASLRVVRRGRHHGARPVARSCRVAGMIVRHGGAKAGWL